MGKGVTEHKELLVLRDKEQEVLGHKIVITGGVAVLEASVWVISVATAFRS